MKEKRVIDREGIEREYRAGVRSVREIAAEFEVSHTLINRWARDEGWERDLGAKIRAKADALVSKEAVSSLVSVETRIAEKQIVEANAAIQAQIRREHRTDIQRTKRIANKLLEALEDIQLPRIPTEGTEAELQPARAMLVGVIREHTAAVKQLADTQRVAVNMEREAFGIAQMVEDPADDDKKRRSDPVADARRVAFILSRASALLPSKG